MFCLPVPLRPDLNFLLLLRTDTNVENYRNRDRTLIENFASIKAPGDFQVNFPVPEILVCEIALVRKFQCTFADVIQKHQRVPK